MIGTFNLILILDPSTLAASRKMIKPGNMDINANISTKILLNSNFNSFDRRTRIKTLDNREKNNKTQILNRTDNSTQKISDISLFTQPDPSLDQLEYTIS